MGISTHQRGFTVIEVILFLAITSLLVMGILLTSSATINQQRYRDSVSTLQGLIQQQYNETSNVINPREPSGDRKCTAAGIVLEQDDITATEPRGTSECLVMGRYLRLSGGRDITVSSVLGFRNPTAPDPTDDIVALQQYTYFVSKADKEDSSIAWGGTATAKNPLGPITGDIVVLTLRSPLTGANRTFVFRQTSSVDVIPSSVINTTNMDETKICIDPALFMLSQTIGVVIRANASNASSIELTGVNGC